MGFVPDPVPAGDSLLDEQKKALLPFMSRAQEMQQHEPKVAYYCRLYAVQQAMAYPKRAPAITDLVMATVAELEKAKPSLQLDPENDKLYCEGFAQKIFFNADRVDRAGRATEDTSKAFYAAALFLGILSQFGDLQPDLVEKQKYAAYRAAEIRKAIREGRPPLAPARSSGDLPAVPPSGPMGAPMAGSGSFSGGGAGGSRRLDDLPGLPPLVGAGGGGGGGGSGRVSDSGLPPLVSSRMSPSPSSGGLAPPTLPRPAPAADGGASLWGGSAGGGGGGGGSPAAAAKPVQRFQKGSPVLLLGSEDGSVQQGTVDQVLSAPGQDISYAVALADGQWLQVPDMYLVPHLGPGSPVSLVLPPHLGGTAPLLATVVDVDSAAWPPTFVVQTQDGSQQRRGAHELSMVLLPPSDLTAPADRGVTAGDSSASNSFTHTPSWRPAAAIAPPPPAATPPPPPPPQQPPQAPAPPPQSLYQQAQALAAQPQYQQQAAPPPAPLRTVPGFKPSLTAITASQKAAKYAINCLAYEDVTSAVKYLNEAMALLHPPQ